MSETVLLPALDPESEPLPVPTALAPLARLLQIRGDTPSWRLEDGRAELEWVTSDPAVTAARFLDAVCTLVPAETESDPSLLRPADQLSEALLGDLLLRVQADSAYAAEGWQSWMWRTTLSFSAGLAEQLTARLWQGETLFYVVASGSPPGESSLGQQQAASSDEEAERVRDELAAADWQSVRVWCLEGPESDPLPLPD